MAGLMPFEAAHDPALARDAKRRGVGSTEGFVSNLGGFQPPAPQQSVVGIDEATGTMSVNGKQFHVDDHDSALKSEAALDGPATPIPEGFRPIQPDEYKNYLNQIDDPSLGRLAKKNFGIGVDNLQLLGGYGMQFLGAEEAGKAVQDQQVEDLRFNQPYQRSPLDDFAGDPIGTFVATLAQQGPNLIESVVTALVGAAAGGVAGGGANPFTAMGGAFMALGGKQGLKQALLAAAKKRVEGATLNATERKLLQEAASIHAAKTATKGQARTGAKKEAVEEVLDTSKPSSSTSVALRDPALDITPSNKALSLRGTGTDVDLPDTRIRLGGLGGDLDGIAGDLLKRGKRQAQAGGAGSFSLAQNYATGVADVYGEVLETGVGDRETALRAAVPYALLETAPEFLFASKMFGGLKKLGGKGGALRRGVTGLGLGAAGEGLVEAGQEGLIMGSTGQLDLMDEGVQDRLLNSFFAGAMVGGPLGAGANIMGGEQVDGPETAGTADAPRGIKLRRNLNTNEQVDLLAGPADQDLLEGPGATPLIEPPLRTLPPDPQLEGPEISGQLPPPEGRDVYAPGTDLEGYTYDGDVLGPEGPQTPNAPQPITGPQAPQGQLFDANEPLSPAQNLAQEGTDFNVPPQGAPVPNAVAAPVGLPGVEGAPQGELNLAPSGVTNVQAVNELMNQQRPPEPGTGFTMPDPNAPMQQDRRMYDGEPTIMMPHRNPRTGEVEMAPVSVREAIGDSQQRIDALSALRACLKGAK
jgi:hypothetical protein